VRRIIRNDEIAEVVVGAPSGHRHIRATIRLSDGSEIVLQEAAVAAIVRAFVTVKTHPVTDSIRLAGRSVDDRKSGFAEWQLMEE
jgi:hypothetical protein